MPSLQITLWGPKGEHLDYAYKHWSGLFEDYYKPRWTLFFKTLADHFFESFDEVKFRADFFEQERILLKLFLP